MKKRILFSFLFVLPLLMTACFKNNKSSSNNSSGGESQSSTSIPDKDKITVTFYVDLNQKIAKNIYSQSVLTWGDKITKPADPTEALDPAFPVFKGWSLKDVIDDDSDLFDFSKPLSEEFVDSYMTVDLYGIWVAEGE